MANYDLTVTDTHTTKVVEIARNVRIPDRMRIDREYCGLEHDGRFKVTQTKRNSNHLNQPVHYART